MFRLRRPSGAFVVACVALFVALSGGAYAATTIIPNGSVNHAQLASNAVWHNNLAKGSVRMDNLSSSLQQQLSKSGTGGKSGSNGTNGAQGAPGSAGSQGPKGPAGPQGSQGPAGPQGPKGDTGPQGPAGAPAPQFDYEVDTGGVWSLSNMPLALAQNGQTEADAAVVVDAGPASQFTGITMTGSANLTDSVWISDKPEAYTFGENSGAPTFTYGRANGDGTFNMTTGSFAGSNLSPAQIAADYPGYEVYAWVGIASSDTSTPMTATVTSVNGMTVNATLTLNSTTSSAENGS